MVDDIISKLIEGNNQYQWKLLDEKEDIKTQSKIPKYPLLILTCMDLGIDIHRIFQMNPGDVFILRNAGNQYSEDMLRSILIAIHVYNVQYIIILGHLGCIMKKINLIDLKNNLSVDLLKQIGQSSVDLQFALQRFFKPFTDEIRNINNQVEWLKKAKGIPQYIKINGMLYDPASGWVFTENEFTQYQVYESFMHNYSKLLNQKKMGHVDFLETIENEIIGTESSKVQKETLILNQVQSKDKETIPINLIQEVKGNKDEHYAEVKKTLENNMEELNLPNLEKFLNLKISVQKPKIYVPKIKIYVPTIHKSKDNGGN